MKRVVIVGGGFAGINCARGLAGVRDLEVTLLDRRNYHLFQPLLYQVAMAGLSPADIASPIRGIFAGTRNVRVVQAEVKKVVPESHYIESSVGRYDYDYLVLASGAQHTYFGSNEWEEHAPGLKSLEQATEIRRRVLSSFERAECERDPAKRRAMLTFGVVGGGPTGVELAGALGEMTRFTLAKDFHNIDPKLTRIVLIEAGSRILPSFSPVLAGQAMSELSRLGVQLWPNSRVTRITADGVFIGNEHLAADTVIWAAGVQASPLGKDLGSEQDRQGRVKVCEDLSLASHSDVFVVGDQAHFQAEGATRALPGVATVAIQQGRHVARTLLRELKGRPRVPFRFVDKGQMATIGRRRAIMQRGRFATAGIFAWLMWLVVHIYFLIGFRRRLFVLLQWSWSYLTFARGTRLITERQWRFYAEDEKKPAPAPALPVGVVLAAEKDWSEEATHFLQTKSPASFSNAKGPTTAQVGEVPPGTKNGLLKQSVAPRI